MVCVTTQTWSIINNSSENIFCYIVYYKYNSYSQLHSKCLKHRPAHDKHLNKWMVLRDIFASSAWKNHSSEYPSLRISHVKTLFLYLNTLYNYYGWPQKFSSALENFSFFLSHEICLGLKPIHIISILIERVDGYIVNLFFLKIYNEHSYRCQ